MEPAGAQAAADAGAGLGRRASRKPRVNYANLISGLEVVPENEDPNAPTERSQRGKESGRRQAPPVDTSEQDQPAASKAAAGSRGKRRATSTAAAAAASDEAGSQQQQGQQQEPGEDGGEWGPEAGGAGEPAAAQPRKSKRQRVLVDVHGGAAAAQQDPEECENEYERARLERIKRNQEVLAQLGIRQMAQDLVTTCHQPEQPAGGGEGAPRPSRPHRPRERAPALPLQPMRKSARMRGLDPAAALEEAGAAGGATELRMDAPGKEAERVELLELEEYFKLQEQDVSGALVVDGRFHGWVNPVVRERYGVAGSADEAWESNGGGKFSFKIDRKAIPAHLRNKGWSDARAFSSTQLQKNPNSYFYRHTVPHEPQAQGEWTAEEHELFLSTARAHGVGDKWGLFASYIPQRVGYQCSAYYRDVIIPSGLILDNRFKMTRDGKAVFVG